MPEMTSQQSLTIIIALFFFAAIFLYSRMGKNKDKDIYGQVFGIEKKKKEAKKETPREKNGSGTELTLFASQLLRTAAQKKMRVVMPGVIDYKGTSTRLTALVVSPDGVTGVFCLGYGGTVTFTESTDLWKQKLNGQEKEIESPIEACKKQRDLLEAAMTENGIKAPVSVVAVFTNGAVKLSMPPSATVYTAKDFLAHIKETDALARGDVDVEKVTKELAVLADIKGKKEAWKETKKKARNRG